eukprot:1196402-Prorocentrum_minimum.AAC.4
MGPRNGLAMCACALRRPRPRERHVGLPRLEHIRQAHLKARAPAREVSTIGSESDAAKHRQIKVGRSHCPVSTVGSDSDAANHRRIRVGRRSHCSRASAPLALVGSAQ